MPETPDIRGGHDLSPEQEANIDRMVEGYEEKGAAALGTENAEAFAKEDVESAQKAQEEYKNRKELEPALIQAALDRVEEVYQSKVVNEQRDSYSFFEPKVSANSSDVAIIATRNRSRVTGSHGKTQDYNAILIVSGDKVTDKGWAKSYESVSGAPDQNFSNEAVNYQEIKEFEKTSSGEFKIVVESADGSKRTL